MFRIDPRRLLLLGCFFLWMFAGCVPEDLVGPSRDEPVQEELSDDGTSAWIATSPDTEFSAVDNDLCPPFS